MTTDKRCGYCKEVFTATRKDTKYCSDSCMDRAWYHKNLERERKRSRDKHRRWKQEVMDHYGAYCHCPGCKVVEPEFLTIEHENGKGTKHRESINEHLYHWLIRKKFPKGFTILCYNCNCSRGNFGYCPHQGRKTQWIRKNT